MITHHVTPELQPTNYSCTQTATAILLSHYDSKYSTARIFAGIPGDSEGASMQRLATYCLDKGFDVEMHSFDARILDPSWAALPAKELIKKLHLITSIMAAQWLCGNVIFRIKQP